MKSSHGGVTSVELFKGLQQTALSSKAGGTVVNYTSSLNRWVKFANTNKLVVFPVSVVDAALFFSHLATSQVSASVIESSYCALKWAHDFAGVPNPMSSTFVKNMVEGAKRQNAKPTSRNLPFQRRPSQRVVLNMSIPMKCLYVGTFLWPYCYLRGSSVSVN